MCFRVAIEISRGPLASSQNEWNSGTAYRFCFSMADCSPAYLFERSLFFSTFFLSSSSFILRGNILVFVCATPSILSSRSRVDF